MSLYGISLRIKGRKRLKYFAEIKKSYANYNVDSVRLIQLQKLRNILLHASNSVNFYKDLFSRIDFDINSFDNTRQILKLPILTKTILKERLADLKSSKYNTRQIFLSSTGGSTGKPTNFYKDINGDEKEIAFMWHCWSQLGWMPEKKMAWFWGGPAETTQVKGYWGKLKWGLGGKFLFDAFDVSETKMQRWYEIISYHGIKCAIGYASTLNKFSNYLLRTNKKLNLDFVISTAEKLYSFQRENVETAFNCKLYDQYGCRENRIIAFECANGKMHIRNDNVYVELIGVSGCDGYKKIIITSLNNYGMPLIRYDTGDYGDEDDGICSCGSPFPSMEMHIGRSSDNFKAIDGSYVHGEFFTHLMYGIDGVDAFRFHQKRIDYLEIRIVKNDSYSDETDKKIKYVKEKCQSVLGRAVNILVITITVPYLNKIQKCFINISFIG